jgi:hypothetical protein
MTTTGEELLSFVREIRRFSSQLASLLGTADKLMSEAGWELATSQNVALANPSASLDKPRKWFPNVVFRFYAESPRALTFISALLDSDAKGEYQLTEPLITAGWFQFAEAAPEKIASNRWWWSRFHGYMPKRIDDGSICSVEPKVAWPKDFTQDWYPFERASTFGLPLAEMTATESLEERVIGRLLSALRDSPVGGRHP